MPASRKLRATLLFGVWYLAAVAAADAGDDFANNLLTDLAPILALFGERVTMQFMSQSTGWADNIILAMAPLGILTIIVAAIRVGGPYWLRSIIGRARENRAIPEAELMSSTSNEVCELWNGQEIVRVMGQGPIREFIILLPEGEEEEKDVAGKNRLKQCISRSKSKVDHIFQRGKNKSEAEVEVGEGEEADGMVKVEALSLEEGRAKGYMKEYDATLRERITGKIITRDDQESQHNDARDSLIVIRNTKVTAPNLALNVHSQLGRIELYLVAVAGIALQLGVLAWAGVATHKFHYFKDEEHVADYAFICMTIGTLLLACGMLLCASIVEGGSTESKYCPAAKREARVLWLQESATVNDQSFKSFALFPQKAQVLVTTSSRADKRKRGDQDTDDGDDAKAQKLSLSGAQVSVTTEVMTVTGTLISIGGFVVQFTGLRAMNWSVSVAQLIAIALMTVLRAWVRRNFTKNPEALPLIPGHELDWLAMTLERHGAAPWRQRKADEDYSRWNELCRPWTWNKDAWDWEVAAVQNPDEMQIARYKPDPKSRSHRAMTVRRDLGKLADWTGVASAEAISLAQAIEFTMRTLFDHGFRDDNDSEDDNESNDDEQWNEFMWSISVSGAPVQFRLSYNNGRWATDANELESVLSLWLYSAHENEQKEIEGETKHGTTDKRLRDKGTVKKPCLQILGAHTPTSCLHQDLKWWLPDGAARVIQTCVSRPHWANGIEPRSADRIETRSADDIETRSANGIGIRSVGAHRVVGFATNKNQRFPSDQDIICDEDSDEVVLAVESFSPLKKLYAQHMFSAFMWALSNKMEKRIEDTVEVRAAQAANRNANSTWQSIALRSSKISKLAQGIEATGLGNQDEVYLAIIPALSSSNRLPRIDPIIEWTRDHVFQYERRGHWTAVIEAYIWLLKTTRTHMQKHIMIKATALLIESVQAITEVIEIRKRQQLKPGSMYYGSLVYAVSRTSQDLLRMVDATILRAILRLYEKQRRRCEFPGIEYEGELTKTDKAIVNFRDVLGCAEIRGGEHLGRRASKIFVPNIVMKADILDWTLLHYAVANSQGRNIDIAGNAQIDVNARDIRGRTPLHYACQLFEDDEVVQTLLSSGAHLDIQDVEGRAPIHFAAISGRAHVVQALIDAGANVDVLDGLRQSPLAWAAYKAHVDIVSLLWADSQKNLRDQNGRTCLHLAVMGDGEQSSMDKVVGFLLDKGVSYDAKDMSGRTPLHLAVSGGNATAAQQLLDRGAAIEATDSAGHTPLHLAARCGWAQVAKVLLDGGADVEALTPSLCTPLHFAAGKKHKETMMFRFGDTYSDGYEATVKVLLNGMAKINAINTDRQIAILLACETGDINMVKLLLDKGADHDLADRYGRSPLHIAARYGHPAVVELLLARGADYEARDEFGCRPLHDAAEHDDISVAKILLQKGADVLAKNLNGDTPLHRAACYRRALTVQYLLENGADIEAKTVNGETALDVANRKDCNKDAVRTLENWKLRHGK